MKRNEQERKGRNMELELKKECLDVFEAGDRQTLTQEETAETARILPELYPQRAVSTCMGRNRPGHPAPFG